MADQRLDSFFPIFARAPCIVVLFSIWVEVGPLVKRKKSKSSGNLAANMNRVDETS